MERNAVYTADGSSTIHVPGLGEHYHSVHGAEQESLHIYVRPALEAINVREISILEFGFGTGLNAILSLAHAISPVRKVSYHAVEKYPLSESEVSNLRFSILGNEDYQHKFNLMHAAPWNTWFPVTASFQLYKELSDFRVFKPLGMYHIIFFDAFSPDAQPHLWTDEIFNRLYSIVYQGGILTTYSSKGLINRRLQRAGFDVKKNPGPPGKREFLVARKSG